MVRIRCFYCWGLGLIPGLETKIPQPVGGSPQEKNLFVIMRLLSLLLVMPLLSFSLSSVSFWHVPVSARVRLAF